MANYDTTRIPCPMWRTAVAEKKRAEPMRIELRPLRHEVRDGMIRVYGK